MYRECIVLGYIGDIFPTEFNGRGFLIRAWFGDYTKLQEGPLRPL